MTEMIHSTLEPKALLNALAAIGGSADEKTLATLVEQKISAAQVKTLTEHPDVSVIDNQFILDSMRVSAYLSTLEKDDLPTYRELHTRAVGYLAQRLQAGDGTVESLLLAIFLRLANRLQTDNPRELLKLAGDIDSLPLTLTLSRQWCAYFRAVGLRDRERYDEALVVFDTLLESADLEPNIRGRALSSRAYCYHLIGRLQEAMQGHQQSLELCRQVGNRQFEGNALLNMGIVAYDLHNYDEAETYLGQAQTIFEEIGSSQWLAGVYNELGLINRDRGQWAEALAYFEKYVAYRQAEGAQDRVARGLNNMGEVLLFQGNIQEAVVLLEEALTKMTSRVYRVDAYLHVGLAFQALDDLEQAAQKFRQALTLALEIGRRDILAEVHYRLGECLSCAGDPEAALAEFERAVAVIEATREPLQDEGLKISLLGRWQQIYEALILHCLTLGRPVDAFRWTEQARARAFTDILLASRLADEAVAITAPARLTNIAALQARLAPGDVLLSYFTTGVLDYDMPMLKAIPADNPLRPHLLTPARTLLFVVTANDLAAHVCPLDPNVFATASRQRADYTRFLQPNVRRRLSQNLVKIGGNAVISAKRWHLIPHGPVHHLPFVALIEFFDKGEAPLVAYAPSATLLSRPNRLRFKATGSESSLAVGFSGLNRRKMLRFAEPEAKMVAQFSGGQAWIGPEPKRERLRAQVADRQWLHFACHGWFNYEQPLESYLEIGQDEQLTAREILQTWQLKADLVVLSACQTGISRILRGDEPMGLVRAFLSAGARTVVVSRWAVEDLPTFLLMNRFYQSLRDEANLDVSAVLGDAQRWLRELTMAQAQALQAAWSLEPDEPTRVGMDQPPAGSRPFDHPKFWAAFMVVGGW